MLIDHIHFTSETHFFNHLRTTNRFIFCSIITKNTIATSREKTVTTFGDNSTKTTTGSSVLKSPALVIRVPKVPRRNRFKRIRASHPRTKPNLRRARPCCRNRKAWRNRKCRQHQVVMRLNCVCAAHVTQTQTTQMIKRTAQIWSCDNLEQQICIFVSKYSQWVRTVQLDPFNPHYRSILCAILCAYVSWRHIRPLQRPLPVIVSCCSSRCKFTNPTLHLPHIP